MRCAQCKGGWNGYATGFVPHAINCSDPSKDQCYGCAGVFGTIVKDGLCSHCINEREEVSQNDDYPDDADQLREDRMAEEIEEDL